MAKGKGTRNGNGSGNTDQPTRDPNKRQPRIGLARDTQAKRRSGATGRVMGQAMQRAGADQDRRRAGQKSVRVGGSTAWR